MAEMRGTRVSLCPVDHDNSEALRAIRRQPNVADWWGPLEDDFPFEEPTANRLAIVSGGDVVGMVQFTEENEPDYRNAEVDIFLDTKYHGRGLGTDTLLTLARHLIEQRGHHRLVLGANIDNARAIRCYEKAGFKRVGVTRLSGRDYRTGEYGDELFMELVVEPRRSA
ncbi:MAG: GNAT family N-acetyltransferase [Thermoleophilaceae bacterium]